MLMVLACLRKSVRPSSRLCQHSVASSSVDLNWEWRRAMEEPFRRVGMRVIFIYLVIRGIMSAKGSFSKRELVASSFFILSTNWLPFLLT